MAQSTVFSKTSIEDFYGQPAGSVASPPANYGRFYYDSTNGVFVGLNSAGSTIFSSLGLAPNGFPLIPSAKITPIPVTALASGENDIYTVPAGKRATIAFSFINISGSNVNTTVQIKVSGVYYQVGILAAITGTGAGSIPVNSTPFSNAYPVLEAGESFSVLTSATGVSVVGYVLVFDNTEPYKSPKLLTLASGNNTLYTCPAGKVAYYSLPANGTASFILIFNASGTTRTYTTNAVPNGGSVSAANQISTGTGGTPVTVANLAFYSVQNYFALSAGGFLSINSDSSAAGQVAWMRPIVEIPA